MVTTPEDLKSLLQRQSRAEIVPAPEFEADSVGGATCVGAKEIKNFGSPPEQPSWTMTVVSESITCRHPDVGDTLVIGHIF